MNAKRWDEWSDGPLMGAALIFLAAYSWQVLAQPPPQVDRWIEVVQWVTWGVFLVDYVVRLVLARDRGRWLLRHLLDLAAVALPVLRPLRLLRLVALLSVFQRAAGSNLRGRVVTYALGSTSLLIYVASLAVLETERHADGAVILHFGNALWWAFTTITTVGYGDTVPVTTTGRVIAVALMIGGVALLGTITATIASWLVQQVADQDEASQVATRQQVAELSDRIDVLTDLLLRRDTTPLQSQPVNGQGRETPSTHPESSVAERFSVRQVEGQ